MTIEAVLLRGIRAGAGAPAVEWIERAVAHVTGGGMDDLLDAYTQASRWLGRSLLALGAEDARFARTSAGTAFERWTIEDAGRLLLLLARRDASSRDGFVEEAVICFDRSDAREQQSWLRGVALLPAPDRFLPQAVDACRTNILPLFESVACENPYPAAFFPDLNFNQMVLKALFNGVALVRVVGLAGRLNPALARMAADYAAERRAAGRTVPADISLVTEASASERTL
jgi:hypothetical protein